MKVKCIEHNRHNIMKPQPCQYLVAFQPKLQHDLLMLSDCFQVLLGPVRISHLTPAAVYIRPNLRVTRKGRPKPNSINLVL